MLIKVGIRICCEHVHVDCEASVLTLSILRYTEQSFGGVYRGKYACIVSVYICIVFIRTIIGRLNINISISSPLFYVSEFAYSIYPIKDKPSTLYDILQ